MFSFLSRMRLPAFNSEDGVDNKRAGLPPPVTHRRGDSASSTSTFKDGRPMHLNTLAISAPIPRSSPSSITGFDNDNIPSAPAPGSSNASVSTGSAVTAYQYHHLPTSFSPLRHQQQQTNAFGYQGQRFYSQSVAQRTGLSKTWTSPEIGIAISGEEEEEEEIDEAEIPPEDQADMVRYAHGQFPAVIRLDSGDYSGILEGPSAREYTADQMGRSVSSPPSVAYIQEGDAHYAAYGPGSVSSESLSATPGGQGRFNLRLNTNAEFAQGMQSLRLVDHIAAAAATDVFAGAYDYPRAKQLSPIAEVDYVSPDSLKKAQSLPFMARSSLVSRQNTDNTTNTTDRSPVGSASQGSEVTRPSPVYSSPFITRPLNRTGSQTSHVSTASTRITTSATTKSTDPAPSLPPLDLRPPFPGPHPSQGSTTVRVPRQQRTVGGLSTIVGSEEGGSKYTTDDVASLHADSFVTASTRSHDKSGGGVPPTMPDEGDEDDYEEEEEGEAVSSVRHHLPPSISGESRADLGSTHSGHSRVPYGSESFIARRWESDVGYGSGGRVRVLRTRKQTWLDRTPAFWAFWLGFMCPFLWLVGGWHFTNFGEQPPRLTFWEFYFNTRYWKGKVMFCLGRRKKTNAEAEELPVPQDETVQETASSNGTHGNKGRNMRREPPPVTRWVAEKQSSDQRRERLYDPKRSMRGISFGYPFIPRSMALPPRGDRVAKVGGVLLKILAAPHRLFDQLYGVKLMEVRGRPETMRRMFDPWIQRCRYAFCYALILLSIGLCTTSTYLIIYNTRELRS